MLESCDVIVVGGGPAGSTCARRLVDAGARVIVVDQASFPRDKVCAGWITPQVIDAVRLDVDEYSRGRTFQPITGFRVGTIGQRDATTVGGAAMLSAAIRRCEFDTYLLHRSGASLRCGEAVTSIRREDNAWVVNDRWTAPMVVGAGGARCPVARLMNGPAAPQGTLIVAREAEYELPPAARAGCRVEAGVAEIYFTADVAGYGWCVRKDDRMNIGIGRLDRHLRRADVEQFAAFAREARGVESPGLDAWRGHSYVSGAPRVQRRTADGAMLIGDAAGLADVRSGEGIGPAVESAIVGAAVIAACAGDVCRDRLARYDTHINDRWQPHGAWAALAGAVPARLVIPLVGPLLRSRLFVERLVVNRWFLHAHDRHARVA